MNKTISILLSVIMLISVIAISTESVSAKSIKLSRPTNISVTLKSISKSFLSWKKVKNASKYEVYCSINNKKFKKVAITNTNKLYHTGLKECSSYRYKIRAVKGNKKSAFSYIKTVKTISQNDFSLKATASGARITLNWSQVKNASGYLIYRKNSINDYHLIGNAYNNLYKDSATLDLNTTYTYKIIPYIYSNGKKLQRKGKTISVLTDKKAYLLDLVKPYEKPSWYKEESCIMGGEKYFHGFTCMGYGEEGYGNVTSFNLKGKYKKLSFDAGILDGDSNKNNANIFIYEDGELISQFEINSGKLPQHYTVDVSNCIQLKICVYSGRWVAQWDSNYGIANLIVEA